MEDQPTTVSREAHERMTRERDELKAKVEELNRVVMDVGYRDKARSYFKSKGAPDPDWAAEFALPHLRDVELDKLEETLASERFAPLVSMASMQAPTTQEPQAPPTNPGPVTSFSGPNPGAVGGPPPQPGKIQAGSKEYYEIVRKPNGRARIAELAEQGMVEWRDGDTQNGGVAISDRFR